ncbi:MAG: hypothetical protein R6U61_04835 [Thermoplasmata archaeon]
MTEIVLEHVDEHYTVDKGQDFARYYSENGGFSLKWRDTKYFSTLGI